MRRIYVITEANGQQFKAEQGKKLFAHYIQNTESGAAVEFDKVSLVDNNGEVTVGAPIIEGIKIICEILSPLIEGDKVLASHEKRRRDHRKLDGHRQQFTEASIKEVITQRLKEKKRNGT